MTEGIPSTWNTTKGGDLSLSTTHFKSGSTSIKWDWTNGSTIKIINPEGLIHADQSTDGGIKFWFYHEERICGKFTFRLGTKSELAQNNPPYQFEVGGDFTGWRAVWIILDRDAVNVNYTGDREPLEMMDIIPPSKIAYGRTFFDPILFTEYVQEGRSADYQVPYIKYKRDNGIGSVWDRSYYYSQLKPTELTQEEMTIAQKQSFQTIQSRLDEWIFGNEWNGDQQGPFAIRYQALQRYIKAGLKKFDRLQIKRNQEGFMTGIPLYASRSDHGPKFGTDVARPVFLALVYDYKLNGNESSKEKLFDLFDYYHDQGWAEGSGIGILNHETNRQSGYFFAVYMMRQELKETGRLERELATVCWYVHFNKIYSTFGEDYTIIDADELRTRSMYLLFCILLMKDSPEKVRDMQRYLIWMNNALKTAPGYAGTIKEDFMGFHHRGVYLGSYSSNAYQTGALVTYLLHDTEFTLAEESIENVRQALLTLRKVSNKYDMPKAVRGRMPDNLHALVDKIPAYAYMALAKKTIDLEMAQAFMRLWNPDSPILKEKLFTDTSTNTVEYSHTLGAITLMEKVARMGYSPEKDPQGLWVKPTAALAIVRQNDWLVSIKGWSQYVYDFESQSPVIDGPKANQKPGQNVFGRYEGYGAVQMYVAGKPISEESSGYMLEAGWNWNRWPGTTAIHLPLEQLMKTDHRHRSFTDQTFVGGTTMDEKNGMFSMILHDSVYNPSFWANKSYFIFGNEIIAIGTGIQNNDENHPTETTLFQSFISDPTQAIYLNSEQQTIELPYEYRGEDGQLVWLIDPYGNGYILPDAKGLHVKRNKQISIDHSGVNKTEGLYSTAWINHGTSPVNQTYEYVILVQTTPTEISDYANGSHYEVKQIDQQAHIVYHHKEKTIGYAIFDPSIQLSEGVLHSVSTPVMAMEKRNGNTLKLSITDPDLRLPKLPNMDMDDAIASTPGKVASITIELNGSWQVGSANNKVDVIHSDHEKTIITMNTANGQTYELLLADESTGTP